MSPAKAAAPAEVVPTGTPKKSAAARWILTAVVVLGALFVSALSAWISYHTIEDLALWFSWPAATAWMLMPIIEVFILVGMAAHQLERMEGESGLGPKVLAYLALTAAVACNVAHPLVITMAQPGGHTPPWVLWTVAGFSALAPLGQMASVHLATKRLGRIAQQYQVIRPVQKGPKVGGMIMGAVGRRVVAAIDQPAPASSPTPAGGRTPARSGGRAPAKKGGRRKGGPGPVALMRAFWEAERAEGREPSLADMDRAAGVTYQLAKNYRQRWLEAEAGVPNIADRRAAER